MGSVVWFNAGAELNVVELEIAAQEAEGLFRGDLEGGGITWDA
jgi:hypothetical protein